MTDVEERRRLNKASVSVTALEDAARHAHSQPLREVCGMFVEFEGMSAYIRCANVAKDPRTSFEISVEDIIDLYQAWSLVALFHSHPAGAGSGRPSKLDYQQFPVHYVPRGLLYDLGTDTWVWYNRIGILSRSGRGVDAMTSRNGT